MQKFIAENNNKLYSFGKLIKTGSAADDNEVIVKQASLEELKKIDKLGKIPNVEDHDFAGAILLKNNKIIGYGYLDDGFQHNIYIEPEYRQEGYGTLLMQNLNKLFKGHIPPIIRPKPLTEDTRTVLLNKSRNVDVYKNQRYGKNRFARKKLSKVANTVKQYNQINMNDLFKRDILTVDIPVIGETNNYTVTLRFDGVIAELAKLLKSNNNKFEFKIVIQALTKVFNTTNIKVKCTCDDFKYRYAHNLIVNNNSVDDSSKDPGPGRTGMTAQMKGQGCKHILLVLANLDFMMKVASVIKNYITWMDKNNKDVFKKVIFPKLYNLTPEDAQEKDIIPGDVDLLSKSGLIDIINDWAKNRGKFVKGSNINPVKAEEEAEETKNSNENK